jgi:hypothetical protein
LSVDLKSLGRYVFRRIPNGILRQQSSQETPTTSSGEETSVDRVSDGLEEDLFQMGDDAGSSAQDTGDLGMEAGSSNQGVGVDLDSYTRGAWMGFEVTQAEID